MTTTSAAGTQPGPFQVAIDRDVVAASGPDAATFLQGQLSQDVAGLAVGESTYSLLLQPQGKVDAWLRVTRTGDTAYLLDVEGGWGPAVVARLERFKLRTKCDLQVLEGWTCWAVRGAGAGSLRATADAAPGSDAWVLPSRWPGDEGAFDRLGPSLGPLDGVPVADAEQYVAARVAAGVPALGSELDDSTIPAEAGPWLIDRSVSFTKGCYTGQELVARVDSRGSNTPRKLRMVRSTAALAAGAELRADDGSVVGTVTTAAVAVGGSAALAYVARSVEAPATLRTAGGDEVRVEPLPQQ